MYSFTKSDLLNTPSDTAIWKECYDGVATTKNMSNSSLNEDISAIAAVPLTNTYVPVIELFLDRKTTSETKTQVVENGTQLKIRELRERVIVDTKNFNIAIKDIKVYDEKAVVVEFKDGTSERAVTHPDDTFSLEQGVSICLMKKILGGSSAYNKVIKYALGVMKENKKAEEKRLVDAENAKRKREKAIARKQRRLAKKREEAIEIQKEAYLRAIGKYNRGMEDDCK